MNQLATHLTLERFDLLPPSYRYRIRVKQVLRSWIGVMAVLLAVFLGSVVTSIVRIHGHEQTNAQIACAAMPLRELRDDVGRLQADVRSTTQWCELVESARPDDSGLQALAAIAMASQNEMSSPGESPSIIIDTLHLRFLVEQPASVTSLPAWALPKLAIAARAQSRDAVELWVDRLNQVDRIEQASLEGLPSSSRDSLRLVQGGFFPVKLNAIPLATRVLP